MSLRKLHGHRGDPARLAIARGAQAAGATGREPNRFRGQYGAARAAEQAGDAAKAKRYYTQLVKVAGKGDARPELAVAKKYLAMK